MNDYNHQQEDWRWSALFWRSRKALLALGLNSREQTTRRRTGMIVTRRATRRGETSALPLIDDAVKETIPQNTKYYIEAI